MGYGNWVVESTIRFNTTGISQLERAGMAVNSVALREAELTGQITAQEASWLRLQRQAEAAGAAQMSAANRFAGGVALIGAVGLGYAIDKAADFERSMLNLQIATNSSQRTMDRFRQSIYDTARAVGDSVGNVAQLYGEIASTSGLPASSLTPAFFSQVTKFAEIAHYKSVGTSREVSTIEAGRDLIELAHQYRAYSPEGISKFSELLHRATYFMPGGLSQFLTQSKYFTPLMALSGDNYDAMNQSVLLGILLQQTGLGRGKGGSSVSAFERQIMQGLAVTKFQQGGRRDALIQMGLIDPKTGDTPFVRHNEKGQEYFDVIGALSQVQRYADQKTVGLTGGARDRAEETILRNTLSALGVQGSLIAQVAVGGGLQQMRNVQARTRGIPSIQKDLDQRLHLFWGEWGRSSKGVESLFTTLGNEALPEATRALHVFADTVWSLNDFFEHHKTVGADVMGGAAYIGGALVLRTVASAGERLLKFAGVLGTDAAATGGETVVGAAGAATIATRGLMIAMRLLNPELALWTLGIQQLIAGLTNQRPPGFVQTGADGRGYYSTGNGFEWTTIGARPHKMVPFHVATPQQQLKSDLRPIVVNNPVVHVNAKDLSSSDPLWEQLSDPSSTLYTGTKTHSRIPRAVSTPPR